MRKRSTPRSSSSASSSTSSSGSSSASTTRRGSSLGFGRRFINRDFKHVGGTRTRLALLALTRCFAGVNGRQMLDRDVSMNVVSPCHTRIRCLGGLVGGCRFFGPCHHLVDMGAISNFRKRRESIVLVSLMHSGSRNRVNFLGSLHHVGITVAETHVGLVVLNGGSAVAGRPFCGGL